MIAAAISRARAGEQRAGEWRVTRTGDAAKPLLVSYRLSGDAVAGRDYAALAGSVTIPAGEYSATVPLKPLKTATDDRIAIVTLDVGASDYNLGCPAQTLIVIRR